MAMTVNRGSKPDAYDVVLSDLRAQRDRIDQAIAAIEDVRGTRSQGEAAPVSVGSGPYTGMAIHDAAKVVLRERGEPMGNGEIVEAIRGGGLIMKSVDAVNTVGAVLTRRAKEAGDLVKVGRGVWGLPEWAKAKPAEEELREMFSERSPAIPAMALDEEF